MEQTFTKRVKAPWQVKLGGAGGSAKDELLRAIGGEPLAGSGFENEVPEVGFSDNDTTI